MENKSIYLLLLWYIGLMGACQQDSNHEKAINDYPFSPVPFTSVHINEGFWKTRLDTNREVTILFDFAKCEETGRINNFAVAGGIVEGDFKGRRYDDSDVFKVIEGASYSLSRYPDENLEAYLDSVIALIAAAQEDDGYLFTTRTINPDDPLDAAAARWENLERDHELYNVGHMYEAAVAHYQATGKRTFLDSAIKNANLIDSVFGPGKKQGVPGHQEIEIGLAKLYRVTGDERYLNLARFFLDQRGNGNAYSQDHLPVTQQTKAVGHAVRAGYMYAGMADVAALTHDSAYLAAMDSIWHDVVSTKLYITGGVGASREGEAFGKAYELPNATAYNETCAAIASMLWNYRLFLLHGKAQYMDVFERTLYNGFLSGVSLDGNSFFYPNPLESDGKTTFNQGKATRSPWFSTACCPVNVVRFLPSLAGYIYATHQEDLYVNLYINSSSNLYTSNHEIGIIQETGYPWEGDVSITVTPDEAHEFALMLRIPGWANNQPVPSELYRYKYRDNQKIVLKVNGEPIFPELVDGYARIQRKWQSGDYVELSMPMTVRQVVAHEAVSENSGKIALERGPLVYCVEGVDHGGSLANIVIPQKPKFEIKFQPALLKGILSLNSMFDQAGTMMDFMAIPYYAWSHRGEGEMKVWLPVE